MKSVSLSILAAFILVPAVPVQAGPPPVPYPEGYRDWTHVKSMVIEPGHPLANPFEGIHHIYVNASAREGLRNGTYPDGSVLVFDLLETVRGDAAVSEGGRKLVGVMVRDAARYAATGGWGFEGFAGNSRSERLTDDGGAGCYACHQPEPQGVFTRLRD